MSYFPSLPGDSGVRHAMTLNKPAGRALLALHTAVMRQPSDLSPGEREMIAAFVSALNSCRYCYGVHSMTAAAYGMDADLLTRMIDDVSGSGVADRLIPILDYVRKLTLSPSRIVDADAAAVFAAGWSEQALHDAINVACLFSFMNRFADGHGIKGTEQLFAERGQALMKDGYDPLNAQLND